MAFLWLLLTMILAGISVPGSIVLFAKLGWTEPFPVEVFGRRWCIGAWSLFARTAPTRSVPSAHFALVGGSHAFATTAAVSIICVQLLMNHPQPFHSVKQSAVSAQGTAAGKFSAIHG
jgi:hypothetical protein